MALIICPECGRQISDKAPNCPGCGGVVARGIENIGTLKFDPEDNMYLQLWKKKYVKIENGLMTVDVYYLPPVTDKIENFTLEYFAISMGFSLGLLIVNRKKEFTTGIIDVTVVKQRKQEFLKFKSIMEKYGLYLGRSRFDVLYRKTEEQKVLESKNRAAVNAFILEQNKEFSEEPDKEFFLSIARIPDVDILSRTKELKYLKTVLKENEQVLSAVSGFVSQNATSVFENERMIGERSISSLGSSLMVLTDQRIMLINCHMMVRTEYFEIPLGMINSISYHIGGNYASISVLHGSGGILVDSVDRRCGKPFVERTNAAIENEKQKSIKIISDLERNNISVADELIKLKGLLDAGILTSKEFEEQKAKMLSR